MENNRNFAQIFNCFTEPNNDNEKQYKLSPNELYLYAYLSIRKTRVGNVPSVQSHIELIGKHIKLRTRGKENKKEIRLTLETLVSKGIIKCEMDGDSFEAFFPYNAVLEESGFEPVYGDLFELAETAEQFMVLCVVKRWQSSSTGVCTTGYERWMEILDCGREKICLLLNEMKAAGKIKVLSGQNKRSYNNYWVGNGVPIKQDTEQKPRDVTAAQEPKEVVETVEPSPEVEAIREVVKDSQNDQVDVSLLFDDEDDSIPLIGDSTVTEGVLLAHHLAENQPEEAKDVLYNEQFTDMLKPIPRAVFNDVYIYAEHFRINPNEDIYQQLRRLEISVQYYGLRLYLENDDNLAC